jgi:glycine oxidase
MHAVILGAGLMGRLLAHALAQRGHRVEVHEAQGPDGTGAAARVAAAMLAPLAESAITELPVVRMGQYGLHRWPELLATLAQPVFFQQNGTLVVWHRQDAAEARRFGQLLQGKQQQLPTLAAPLTLDAAALAAQEVGLAGRFHQGLLLPGEGQLDNRQLLDALLQSLQANGVALHWHSRRAPADFQPGQAGQADWLVDCRGLGAQPQWAGLRGVRGEVIRLHAPDVTLTRPLRLIHPRYPIYIAPKPGQVFVVGATEIETDDLSPASVRSTLELLSAAYSVHPGFGEARLLEVAAQARPTLPDNLPALRQLGPRTLEVNGLYRHGFLITPLMVDCALEWLQNQQLDLAQSVGLHVSTPT